MGPCCDDHRQPRRCGQSCSPGCTSPVLWHSVCADSRALDPSPAHPTVLLPLPTHGRPRASSRTHLRRRVRPPRVQTASPQVRPPIPATPTRQTPATDGDIPRGRVRVLPSGGIRRRRGQQSRPPTRRMPPAAQKCPRTRRMFPAATPEYREPVASRVTGAASAPGRRRTTTSGPHTGARSGQTGQDAASSSGGEAPSRGVRVPDPHRSGWLTPIPAAQRVRRGPPGAPGYGHRPAPAHCAGGP